MTEQRPLSGVGVLVTRPAGQAEPLCRLIEAAGGRAIALPGATILPASEPIIGNRLHVYGLTEKRSV